MRLFISSTCASQPWQTSTTSQSFESDPSWTLRVEGRLVNDEAADAPGRRKFSSFFTGIIVELSSPHGEPFPEGSLVEWHESAPEAPHSVEFDGLDVKRKGTTNVNATITLQPKEFPSVSKLSPGLANVLGMEEGTQNEIVSALWQYVRFHNLQNQDDKRIVNCNEALSKAFGVPQFAFPQVFDLLARYTTKREPIIINYTIRTDISSTVGDVSYDLEVQIEDPARREPLEILQHWNDNDSEILTLDNKIALSAAATNTARLKYEFFNQLSENPIDFLNKWVDVQSRNLKVLTSDEGYNEETVRRSDFYTDDLLNENLNILLNARRV